MNVIPSTVEPVLSRNVKGILFADYVRMIRGKKDVDWGRHLAIDDLAYLSRHIQPEDWHPMASFERMGNAILAEVARDQLDVVRVWGRFSVDALRAKNPELVVRGNPVESLRRFHALRATYFDFDALELTSLVDGEAQVRIRYHMGARAEEAASFQTMGFFERLLEAAGAAEISAELSERSWAGSTRTVLTLRWRPAFSQ